MSFALSRSRVRRRPFPGPIRTQLIPSCTHLSHSRRTRSGRNRCSAPRRDKETTLFVSNSSRLPPSLSPRRLSSPILSRANIREPFLEPSATSPRLRLLCSLLRQYLKRMKCRTVKRVRRFAPPLARERKTSTRTRGA